MRTCLPLATAILATALVSTMAFAKPVGSAAKNGSAIRAVHTGKASSKKTSLKRPTPSVSSFKKRAGKKI